MANTAAARLLSTEDVVLEILHRVSSDVPALFRCSVACKRWHSLIAHHSFLRRCWPENARSPSTLLGFFHRQRVDADDVSTPYRLFFMPPSAGSLLGDHPRLLTTTIDGLPDDDSHCAQPLDARRGLLLLRLVSQIDYFESVHMAVCDPVALSCHLLPPLNCRVTFVTCTILTGAECGQDYRYFKVLVIVYYINYPANEDDQACTLYTYSSSEAQWSEPTKCFDEIGRFRKSGFKISESSDAKVVCGAMAHWLVPYNFANIEEPPKYYTLDVSADTCHKSLTELPIPGGQIRRFPTLRVTADGSLSLFCIGDGDEASLCRLHMWKRGTDQVWLHTRAIELNLPRQPYDVWSVRIWPVEKSDTLIIVIDESQYVYKMDVETEEVEELQFPNKLSRLAMPMNIEWLKLFTSRLR